MKDVAIPTLCPRCAGPATAVNALVWCRDRRGCGWIGDAETRVVERESAEVGSPLSVRIGDETRAGSRQRIRPSDRLIDPRNERG